MKLLLIGLLIITAFGVISCAGLREERRNAQAADEASENLKRIADKWDRDMTFDGERYHWKNP